MLYLLKCYIQCFMLTFNGMWQRFQIENKKVPEKKYRLGKIKVIWYRYIFQKSTGGTNTEK